MTIIQEFVQVSKYIPENFPEPYILSTIHEMS
jgi:hypothetical protein